jgi:adenylyltransferase/sulfurtransferase
MSKFYERQILLDNFGLKGQLALSQAEVVIVGLGGLGCAAAQQLAVMGVGRLVLVDGDTVSASNLSRQILFGASDIGTPKVVAAKKALNALRIECEITTVPEFLNENLCEELFLRAKVVVDATDNFDSKLLINAAGAKFAVPIVWANAQKWEGQLAVFDARRGACYQCLLPRIPKSRGGDCNEVGVLGVVPNIIGCMQALECVKVICETAKIAEVPRPSWGELQSYSFRDSSFFKTKITRNEDCPICRVNPKEITLPIIGAPKCGGEDQYPVLSAQKVLARGTFCLVDVRERDEIEALPVKGALALPLSEIEANIGESVAKLELEKLNALFCKSGKRSRKAFDLISQHKILVGNLVILDENAEKLAKI